MLDEVGSSSLFGARFRVNAARALLLPRGTARRRMPLWLQRLKARDLLDAVREYPSFPILVETYRDVLQDAFDMPALARMLDDVAGGAIGLRSVQTEMPSPFASSLQFGFVMDWMYADDTPHAEQRAALLSLDRALLDELLGTEGADAETLVVLEEMLARRRGSHRARARERPTSSRSSSTAPAISRSTSCASEPPRRPRVGSATRSASCSSGGASSRSTCPSGRDRPRAGTCSPRPRRVTRRRSAPLRRCATAARREILIRFISLSGVVSVADVLARYAFDPDWVRERFDEWTRTGRLVRGTFGGNAADRWCSRRLLERARRRELSQARKQIQAVDLERFSRFMFRWQHVAPSTRLDGDDATMHAARQLYGVSRPAELWERELFPARVESYDASAIARLIAAGEMVWVGGGAPTTRTRRRSLRTSEWCVAAPGALGCPSRTRRSVRPQRSTLDAMTRMGAVFFDELLAETSFSSRKLRDALRELVGAGLATNDTIDAMRAVVRWRPLVSPRERSRPDPTRWLPADYAPSANRYVVQRRPNLRRLPRWQRPDLPAEATPTRGRAGGRSSRRRECSAHRTTSPRSAKPSRGSGSTATACRARDVAARAPHDSVARDLSRAQAARVPRRGPSRILRSRSFRRAVRAARGGRALRADETGDDETIVIAVADPANVFALPLPGDPARDPFVRPRSSSALLVAVGGRVVLIAERRGSRVAVRPDTDEATVARAAEALVRHLSSRLRRDLVLETIDGQPAATSPHAAAFATAGFRRGRTA